MKKFSLILMILIAGLDVFSQKDEDARKILDKVAGTYNSYGAFSIDFTITMENKQEDIKETSEGNADIKDGKYKVCVMGTESYFDGAIRYTYIKDAEEVNITEVDEDDDSMMNPAKIFELYKTGFNYNINKKYKEGINNFIDIQLTPICKDVDYTAIIVKVDKATNNIVSFTTLGKEGNDVTIKLMKLFKERSFEDKHFVFDTKANPNVEVIDMR